MTCGCNKSSKGVDMNQYTSLGPLKFWECGCGCKGAMAYQKFMISLLSAVIFYIIAHPATFKFVRGFMGDWVSSASGCPSAMGLLLHSIVFMLVVWGLMYIKNIRNNK